MNTGGKIRKSHEKYQNPSKNTISWLNFMKADVAKSFGLIDEVVEKRS